MRITRLWYTSLVEEMAAGARGGRRGIGLEFILVRCRLCGRLPPLFGTHERRCSSRRTGGEAVINQPGMCRLQQSGVLLQSHGTPARVVWRVERMCRRGWDRVALNASICVGQLLEAA
jgi:hypothetical protein